MAISDFRVGSRRRRHGLIEVSLGPSLPWDGRTETGELFSPLQGAYVPQQELRVHGSLRSHKDAYPRLHIVFFYTVFSRKSAKQKTGTDVAAPRRTSLPWTAHLVLAEATHMPLGHT